MGWGTSARPGTADLVVRLGLAAAWRLCGAFDPAAGVKEQARKRGTACLGLPSPAPSRLEAGDRLPGCTISNSVLSKMLMTALASTGFTIAMGTCGTEAHDSCQGGVGTHELRDTLARWQAGRRSLPQRHLKDVRILGPRACLGDRPVGCRKMGKLSKEKLRWWSAKVPCTLSPGLSQVATADVVMGSPGGVSPGSLSYCACQARTHR